MSRGKILTLPGVGFLIPLLTLSIMPPQPAASPEYQVKAVFLYNFAQFVEWPDDAFAEAGTPLVIGILGNDPFGNYLDETVQGEKVNEHPLEVKRFRNLNEVKTCHILFISMSERANLKNICGSLKFRNILTVGDAPNFTKQGGIIRFFAEKNKTRIRINLEAAKNANLEISSKLLRLAEIVNPPAN